MFELSTRVKEIELIVGNIIVRGLRKYNTAEENVDNWLKKSSWIVI